MALQPGASVKSKWDMTRSVIGYRREYELVAGTNLVEESQFMIAGGTAGQQATTSAGLANEVPLGVSLNGKILATTFTNYETGTVPAVAPTTFTLAHSNIVTNGYTGFADAYVYDNTGATELQVGAAAVAGVSVTLAVATGIITFAVGDAAHSFFVRYRWTMTTAEAREILKQSAIGRGSEDTFDKVVIAHGDCIMYTTMFDCDAPWALNQQTWVPAAGDPVLGAGGVLTTQDNNAVGTPFGRVVSLPSTNDPFLGVEYHAGAAR